MPVSYRFDGDLFRMDFEGEYTIEELMQTYATALRDPAFPQSARFLMDVTGSSSLATRSADDIQAVADFLGPRASRFGSRCAICAPKPVQFGLMRMAQVFGERHGVETSVFASLDQALAWLATDPKPPTDAD